MHADLFEDFLEAISRCFLERDFDMLRERMIYPVTLITPTGPVEMTGDAELMQHFDAYSETCRILQIDNIVRRPLSLEDCGDGTWVGTYETNLLCKGVRATEPYTSSALLREVSGMFRAHSVLNARSHRDVARRQT